MGGGEFSLSLGKVLEADERVRTADVDGDV